MSGCRLRGLSRGGTHWKSQPSFASRRPSHSPTQCPRKPRRKASSRPRGPRSSAVFMSPTEHAPSCFPLHALS